MPTTIVSSLVYTMQDIAGNKRTEGWFLCEYRDATYSTGGEIVDLGAYFRHAEVLQASPVSGAINLIPQINEADYPADGAALGSGRVQMLRPAASGLGGYIASGWQPFLSGTFLSGITSGLTLGILVSGALRIAGPVNFEELTNGLAASGVRYRLHVVGY